MVLVPDADPPWEKSGPKVPAPDLLALLVLYAILFFVYDDLAYVSCYFLFYVNDDHVMHFIH
jgi:hypothetical protein